MRRSSLGTGINTASAQRSAIIPPDLRAEHELLLLCSGVRIDSDHAARVEELLQDSIDWNVFLLCASRNQVLALVSQRLQATYGGLVPAPILEFLGDCSRKTTERNHYLADELKRICALFKTNGILALPFAGPLLAEIAYRDFSLTEAKSLEFVVAPENILQARDLLLADGYRREYTWDAAREAAELRFRRVIGMDRSQDGVHVWLSSELDPGNYSWPLRFDSLRSSTISLAGESISTLTAEDAALHACVHATRDAISPHLSLISDAARLAASFKVDAWQSFLKRASALGVSRKVLVVLTMARDLLGAKFPAALPSSTRSDAAASKLCAHATACMFSEIDYIPGMRERAALQLAARERLIDKARFVIRLALMPTGDDWAVMALPTFLYYAARPLRMLGRRAGWFRQRRLAVFMPTPVEIVEEMLALAQVDPSDTLYDLGCGDGRIVIRAAERFGIRGVGVDLDPDRVAEATAGARAAGVDHLVSFTQQNVMEVDVSSASVVCLFLSPQANLMLRPRLQRDLPTHARIVSRSHDMGDWAPLRTKLVACDGAISRIYVWQLEGETTPHAKEVL
jgi:hypothetical protein